MRKASVVAMVLAAAGWLAVAGAALADGEDVVTLKDGTQIRGTVLKQEPGKYVVIRQLDGREMTISFDDVRRVETAAAPAASGAGAPPDGTKVDTKGGGLFLHGETTFQDAEAKRQQWLHRGGSIVSFEVRGQGYFLMKQTTQSSPLGNVDVGFYGGGGGAGFRVGWMNLKLPDPKLGSTWTALRIGVGGDFQGGGGGVAVSIPGGGSSGQGFGMFSMNFPIYVGGQIGLGSYDGDQWRGVALKLQYQPSYSWTYISGGGGSSSGSFNFAGAEIGIDFVDKNGPLQAFAPRAHGEFFIFVLPPVGDLPLFINIGGGAVWY